MSTVGDLIRSTLRGAIKTIEDSIALLEDGEQRYLLPEDQIPALRLAIEFLSNDIERVSRYEGEKTNDITER